jgi:hypothetical protein
MQHCQDRVLNWVVRLTIGANRRSFGFLANDALGIQGVLQRGWEADAEELPPSLTLLASVGGRAHALPSVFSLASN